MVIFWGSSVKGEWGSDKGLCPLGSRDEGSFVTVKLDPPAFLGGVPLSRYTGQLGACGGKFNNAFTIH